MFLQVGSIKFSLCPYCALLMRGKQAGKKMTYVAYNVLLVVQFFLQGLGGGLHLAPILGHFYRGGRVLTSIRRQSSERASAATKQQQAPHSPA